jgi:cellulose synthase/poly-beta-1,6-N-acetylglucosamine synthase-like glycosyltransferase
VNGSADSALGVVIIGRNEGPRLARCLASVRAIRGLPGEARVVYVDSGSTDGSPRRATEAGAEVIELDTTHPTAALGRNAGWRALGAEFVLFLDGDTILDPDFPRLALEAARRDPQIVAVWGHRREIDTAGSIYNRILDLDWIFRPGFTEYCGGDVLMRRSALAAAGGYDAELIAGDEPELCRRLRAAGGKILHLDALMTGHDLALRRFGQYWRRAVRTGHAYAEVSRRYRDTPDPLWREESRSNWLRGGFWIASPLAAVAASAGLRSSVPALVWVALLATLALRSAWKVRWKTRDLTALAAYGLHSHFQQIPVFWGQVRYAIGQARGRRAGLIEYKQAAPPSGGGPPGQVPR